MKNLINVVIVPAQPDVTKMGLIQDGVPQNTNTHDEGVAKCAVIILGNLIEGKNPHYCYIHEDEDFTCLLDVIKTFKDEEPIIIAFDGSVDEVEVLANYLSKELGEGFDVESADTHVGSGSAVISMTRELVSESFVFQRPEVPNTVYLLKD